jgi:hypothetical protein
MAKHPIQFEHLGIATVLKRQRLVVPPNQRDYLWETSHVKDLFQDIAEAIAANKATYFLGTVVFTNSGDVPEVTDGQQRLATVSILLAAIRDYYVAHKKKVLVQAIETDFLFGFDRDTERRVPKLTLNIDDRDYFDKRILSQPDDKDRAITSPRPSHTLIANAAALAAKHVASIVAPHSDKAAISALERWTKFLENDATVIQIIVPDEVNAFKMFETLNDRGLKVSQAYLVKNFLFGEAGAPASAHMHQKWAQMFGALDSLADDDAIMNYLWNVAIILSGHTRAPEIFDRIKATVTGSPQALEFATFLADRVGDYTAIMQPEHIKWKDYVPSTRKLIETINVLRVKVQRPAMFAVSIKFNPTETVKALKLILSWSVRLLIVGGGRSGGIQESYASIANGIHNGTINNANELANFGAKFAPGDVEFEGAFASANVSASHLARYYLRALEENALQNPEPEFVVNDDATQLTLEHILPQEREDNWPEIAPEVADALVNRMGNQALLQATPNSYLRSAHFKSKVKVYGKSGLLWTKGLTKYQKWGAPEIAERQLEMSKRVAAIWPLKA